MDEHHVHVYASKNNDGTILKAPPRPKDLFRNNIATPALVASIINGKYTNPLPLERQSKALCFCRLYCLLGHKRELIITEVHTLPFSPIIAHLRNNHLCSIKVSEKFPVPDPFYYPPKLLSPQEGMMFARITFT